MFETAKLFIGYEGLTVCEKEKILVEKSKSVLPILGSADFPTESAVKTLAAFILGSAVTDGAVDEREYLMMYPFLVKVFGRDFDITAVKSIFYVSRDPDILVKKSADDMIGIMKCVSDATKTDILSICFLTVTACGRGSLKKTRYVRRICRTDA